MEREQILKILTSHCAGVSKTKDNGLIATKVYLDDLANELVNLFAIHDVGGSACKEHKPMAKQMGYVEWNEWADLKIRRGHIQRQCKKCGKWLFKCEI